MKCRWLIFVLFATMPTLLYGQADKSGIINSRHDFRPQSTATIRAATAPAGDDQLCVYCHTPHNSNPGPLLWNHEMSTTQFPTYTSTTLQSTVPPVTTEDSSKLCLSCHDGTIALGNTVNNGDITFVQGAGYQLPSSSRSNIGGFGGYGFTDDHPFAFAPNFSNTQIKTPDPMDRVKLVAGRIQCSSCHDPHNENVDPTQQSFLVKNNQGSAICLSCHQVTGWLTSVHKQPGNAIEDAKYTSTQGAHTGYTGVTNNGCESCHRPHAPLVAQRLVKFLEENTCYQCHDGSVTTLDVKTEFLTKTYRHPVATTPSVHDASESPNSSQFAMPETSASTPRHSECVDCHNSHQAQPTPLGATPLPPGISPPLTGVKGQSSTNLFLLQAANQYEICFKCHADSANKPQTSDITLSGTGYGRNPQRQMDFAGATPLPTRANTRLEFATRAYFHPVTQPANLSTGALGDVPSLRPYVLDGSNTNIMARPLSGASLIFCTDCHNNDTGRNLGVAGTGPSGPHGTNVAHLLERNYSLETPPAVPGQAASGISFAVSNYGVCDKCHDLQNVVMRDVTFKHTEHVLEEAAACSTCHDAHSSTSPMLINFDTSIVAPNSSGLLNYTRTGTRHGTCNLMCHGENHAGLAY